MRALGADLIADGETAMNFGAVAIDGAGCGARAGDA
jgi:hypothetical protein